MNAALDFHLSITDYCLNDGSTGLTSLTEGHKSGGGSIVDLHGNGWFSPPFSDYRFSLCPGNNGIRFSIFFTHRRVLVCAIANEERVAEAVWRRLDETRVQLQHGTPDFDRDFASVAAQMDDPQNPVYYLKRGCPDLIRPGVKVVRPAQLPFLATLISPPWHNDPDQPVVECAFRLRNGVSLAILTN